MARDILHDMNSKTPPTTSTWKQAVAEYRIPVLRGSLIGYLALWGLMIWTLNISYCYRRLRTIRREMASQQAAGWIRAD